MKIYLIAITILSLLLSGCGGETRDKIRISWWQFWTDAGIKPVINEIIADFEADHPGVKVDLVDLTWADGHDKIAIAFSSGTGPDIVELGSDWVLEFSSSGHLYDMTGAVAGLGDQFLLWEPGLYNKNLFAFPWILGTRILYANKDLLKLAGYEPEWCPESHGQLLEASRKINNLGDNVFGFGSNSAEKHRLYKKFLPFLWSNGGSILSDDGLTCLLNQPEAIEALEYYVRLCKSGLTDTQRRLEDAFLDGKVGFVISGDWLLKRMAREKPEIEIATCLIPGRNDIASSVSFAGGEYLVINSKSEQKELAMKLIRHITSPENQLRFCLANRTANPSSVAAAGDPVFLSQPGFDIFIRQMETARISPIHARWVYIESKLEKGIEEALYGVKTSRQAFSDAAATIQELLDK